MKGWTKVRTFMPILNKKHLKTEIEFFHEKFVYIHYFFLLLTTLGLKLIKPHTEIIISSSKSTIHIGMTDLNFKFLELPNNMLNMDPNVSNLSRYINSSSCQLFFPCVKAGILKTVPRAASSSSIKKLRSTKMQSPCETISI